MGQRCHLTSRRLHFFYGNGKSYLYLGTDIFLHKSITAIEFISEGTSYRLPYWWVTIVMISSERTYPNRIQVSIQGTALWVKKSSSITFLSTTCKSIVPDVKYKSRERRYFEIEVWERKFAATVYWSRRFFVVFTVVLHQLYPEPGQSLLYYAILRVNMALVKIMQLEWYILSHETI